jgi:hypothetical protein
VLTQEIAAHLNEAAVFPGLSFFEGETLSTVQIHAHGATVKPANALPTQAEVMIWKPRVLQITAMRGDLAFTYEQEFQLLPEGEPYRIYLGDDDGRGEVAAAGGGSRIWGASKTGYFIVGGAVAGLRRGGFTTLLIRRAGWRVLRNREEKSEPRPTRDSGVWGTQGEVNPKSTVRSD